MRKMEDTQVCVGIRLFHDDLQISVFILTLLSAGSLILLCIFEPTCKLKGSTMVNRLSAGETNACPQLYRFVHM